MYINYFNFFNLARMFIIIHLVFFLRGLKSWLEMDHVSHAGDVLSCFFTVLCFSFSTSVISWFNLWKCEYSFSKEHKSHYGMKLQSILPRTRSWKLSNVIFLSSKEVKDWCILVWNKSALKTFNYFTYRFELNYTKNILSCIMIE